MDYLPFAINLGTSKAVIVIVYFDDFLFFGPNISKINIMKSFLPNQYKMKDLSFFSQFTDIKLKQNLENKTIFLFQKVYDEKL